MSCGTRIVKGAFPDLKPEVVFSDELFDLDSNLFGVDEMSEVDINANAQEVATKIVRKYFGDHLGSVGLKEKYDLSHITQSAGSCGG